MARNNSTPTDDPVAIGVSSSTSHVYFSASSFSVEGLSPRADATSRFVGSIEFPESDTENGPPSLREDVDDDTLGMPRDLDGSNSVDSEDHRNDYMILPIRIVLEWEGAKGPARFELTTLLTPEE